MRAAESASRVQCRVARCNMGLPVYTSHPLSRVSRAPFLRQSGVVTGTQFLIGLRVLCGLLCARSVDFDFSGSRGFNGHQLRTTNNIPACLPCHR
jgi:hypothetical protein